MSDKRKICAIGEKKLIRGSWYEKREAGRSSFQCAECALLHSGLPCDARQSTLIEDGGYECLGGVWIACDAPKTEAPPVEECAGCRFWKNCGDVGDCRRSSPTYLESITFGQWPTTKRGDWCGEWKQ